MGDNGVAPSGGNRLIYIVGSELQDFGRKVCANFLVTRHFTPLKRREKWPNSGRFKWRNHSYSSRTRIGFMKANASDEGFAISCLSSEYQTFLRNARAIL